MSYVVSDDVVITTGVNTVPSGNFSIELKMAGTSASYTAELLDVGSFEVDFDVQPDFDVEQKFRFNVPELKFTIFDVLSDGTSFISLTDDMNFNDIVSIKTTFNGRSDFYYALKRDFEFDFNDRETKITARYPAAFFAKLEENPTYTADLLPAGKTFDIGSLFSGKLVDFNDDPNESDPSAAQLEKTVFVHDFIEGMLKTIGDNPEVGISSTLYYQSYNDFFDGNQQVGDRAMLFDVAAGRNFTTGDQGEIGFDQAVRYLLDFARSEGAYFGNILGYGFYVSRGLKDNRADFRANLTKDNLLKVGLEVMYEEVGEFDLEIGLYDDGDTDFEINIDEVINQSVRDENGQILVTKVDFNTVGGIDLDVFPSWSEYITNNRFNIGSPEPLAEGTAHPYSDQGIALEQIIFNSYKNALKYDVDLVVKGTVSGIETLKPYQFIRMGNDIHPLVNGKDYRVSKLTYNIVDDTVEFEAYEF